MGTTDGQVLGMIVSVLIPNVHFFAVCNAASQLFKEFWTVWVLAATAWTSA